MPEPQLSSVHLKANPRREDFRRARQRLLDARGSQTVIAEKSGMGPVIMSHSMGPAASQITQLPADCVFVLKDGELIYPLKTGINTIGRFFESDVFLCEKHISRRHCAILVHTSGACDLHDTASRNGTLLNGKRVMSPTAIYSGDRIRLCNREFTFLSLGDFQARRITTIDGDTLS